ncbi:MAG: hypothetical protein M5R36_00060 [Deltaproteobacteria bacterium]|nr:hypothetical protein [Deltaproteobacteria bacterium]
MRLHQELERFHPMFGRFSNQYRVMVMPHFFLALGAGLFLGGLGKGKRTSALIGAAAAAVFAAESVWTSAAPVPAAAHPILMNETQMELDRSPEEFAVFDLPIAFEKPMLHRYIAGQFFHRRPIVYSDFPTRRVAMTPALLKGELLVALLAQAGPAGEAPDDSFSPAFLGLSNAHEGREAYFQGWRRTTASNPWSHACWTERRAPRSFSGAWTTVCAAWRKCG